MTDAVSEGPVAVRRARFLIVSVSWPQALAWRMRRQLLEPVGSESVEGVVRRLGAVQAQFDPRPSSPSGQDANDPSRARSLAPWRTGGSSRRSPFEAPRT